MAHPEVFALILEILRVIQLIAVIWITVKRPKP